MISHSQSIQLSRLIIHMEQMAPDLEGYMGQLKECGVWKEIHLGLNSAMSSMTLSKFLNLFNS